MGIGSSLKKITGKVNNVISKIIPNEIEKFIPKEIRTIPEDFGDIANRAAIALAIAGFGGGGPFASLLGPGTTAGSGLGSIGSSLSSGLGSLGSALGLSAPVEAGLGATTAGFSAAPGAAEAFANLGASELASSLGTTVAPEVGKSFLGELGSSLMSKEAVSAGLLGGAQLVSGLFGQDLEKEALEEKKNQFAQQLALEKQQQELATRKIQAELALRVAELNAANSRAGSGELSAALSRAGTSQREGALALAQAILGGSKGFGATLV